MKSLKKLRNVLSKVFGNGLSSESFDRWHLRRSQNRPGDENRNATTVAISASLFALLMIFLIALAQSRQNLDSYTAKRPLIKKPDERALTWRMVDSQMVESQMVSRTVSRVVSRSELAAVPILPEMTLVLQVPAGLAAPLVGSTSIPVLVLPTIYFKTAEVRVNGTFVRQFFESERITIPLPENGSLVPGGILEISVRVANPPNKKSPLIPLGDLNLSSAEQTILVMPFQEFRELSEFAAADRMGRGDYVGFVGRIIMAIFALVLFLLVDGSPESLGLALFMGFEAAAMSLRFDWLPGIDKGIIANFCFQMGDIFRVYFALQLARIAPKSTQRWVIAGIPLSLLYGYLRHEETRLGWTFPQHIPSLRDILAGGIGLIICVRAATILAGRKLPWRVAALCVAAVGFFEQILDPLGQYIPAISQTAVFTEVIDILQPISAWLLAFSAFINISSLETRVKALSGSEVRAQSLEREMELGKTVQSTFLRVPQVPPPLMLACQHEAAVYVAGDMYFIDWSDSSQQLTVILSDLTGHGVQAALKASATNVIAHTLWCGDQVTQDRRRDRLIRFDGQVQSFLNRLGGDQELNTMLGLEFNAAAGTMEIYRSNFPLPLLISHSPGSHLEPPVWTVTPVILPNRQLAKLKLEPGSFLVIATDGFFSTSQQTAHLVKFLRKNLAAGAPATSAAQVKELILNFSGFQQWPLPDDRTLIVFGLAA